MKLLFIAYYFPPVGGGGVQRSLKFVKYLPEFGIAPHVLTAQPPAAAKWTPTDPTLVDSLPPSVTVTRTPRIQAAENSRPWDVRLRHWFCLPSPFGVEWRRQALAYGSAICEREKPSVIFVTMSPFEGAQIGAELSRRHRLPWIADLRDPWALDEMQIQSSHLHRRIAQQQMRRQLQSAALIVMNTPEAAQRLTESFPELRNQQVISLTNGFDAEDFAGDPFDPANDRFTIVHTGTLHSGSGLALARRPTLNALLGRTPRGVDFRSRSHLFLLTALEHLLVASPSLARRIRVILAGPLSAADQEIVFRSAARHLVEMPGYCSHPETVRLQRRADLLFLPMHTMPPGRRATIVPGKAYEYLAAGRPILAAVPEGDARDFVSKSGIGSICEPDDAGAIARVIREHFDRWASHQFAPRPDAFFLRQFERRELTRLLATHISTVVQRAASAATHCPVEQREGARPLAAANV